MPPIVAIETWRALATTPSPWDIDSYSRRPCLGYYTPVYNIFIFVVIYTMFDVVMEKSKPMLHVVAGKKIMLHLLVRWSRGVMFATFHFGIIYNQFNGLHCPTFGMWIRLHGFFYWLWNSAFGNSLKLQWCWIIAFTSAPSFNHDL